MLNDSFSVLHKLVNEAASDRAILQTRDSLTGVVVPVLYRLLHLPSSDLFSMPSEVNISFHLSSHLVHPLFLVFLLRHQIAKLAGEV